MPQALAATHQPDWPDRALLAGVTARLARMPGLVDGAEIATLRRLLALAAAGRCFVLQAGDCAEPFDEPTGEEVGKRIRLLRLAGRMVSTAVRLPVVPIGRIAGQYAKPRSAPTEQVGGRSIPSYFGPLVNDPEPVAAKRTPDPARLLRGYHHAAGVLDLLREASAGDLALVGQWGSRAPALWTSHEALVLDYERQFVRRYGAAGTSVLASTHLPWIGMRTSFPDSTHVRFLAALANPVACKIGPEHSPADVVSLCRRLDPTRDPGRLVLVCRMGADRIADRLPPIVSAVRESGHPVVWMCDPMHGNTVRSRTGRKTRHLDAILAELTAFVGILRRGGAWPAGVHLEVAAEDVTECVGGRGGPTEEDLDRSYTTLCDPRLNPDQTLQVTRELARLLGSGPG
jgi:3-deoxy-7-phosphoheptulonate synthase